MSRLYKPLAMLYDPVLGIPLRAVRQAVLRELTPHPQPLIMDMCCGTGSQLKLLARRGFTRLHGLDLSPAMLAVADRGHTHLQLSVQNAAQAAVRNEIVDVVILSLALHEKDPVTRRDILSEAHRILKPGGVLLIADYELTEDSSPLARLFIQTIERLAGADHYRNFRSYLEEGALPSLIDASRFHLHASRLLARNTLVLNRYHKI